MSFGKRHLKGLEEDKVKLYLKDILKEELGAIPDPVCPECNVKLFARRISFFSKRYEIQCPQCLGRWPATRFCFRCGKAGRVHNSFGITIARDNEEWSALLNVPICDSCKHGIISLFRPGIKVLKISVPGETFYKGNKVKQNER